MVVLVVMIAAVAETAMVAAPVCAGATTAAPAVKLYLGLESPLQEWGLVVLLDVAGEAIFSAREGDVVAEMEG